MRTSYVLAAATSLCALLAARPSAAQPAPAHGDQESFKEAFRSVFEHIPPKRRQMLSGGALNLMKWSHADVLAERGGDDDAAGRRQSPAETAARDSGGRRVPRVSDTRTDFQRSLVTGFTQSETSTAWCGPNVVISFNDSGSLLETLFDTTGGLSFTGYSRSRDAGRSFTDAGFLNPGPDTSVFLGGDPVVVC